MPYLHKSNSKNYKIELKFEIYGKVPKCSTFTDDIYLATKIEDAIKTVYRKGLEDNRNYWQILDALKPETKGKKGNITAPQIYLYVRENRLHELLHLINDVSLETVLAEFEQKMLPERGILQGINMIRAYMPENARLSWLQSSKNILEMLFAAERGDITGVPNKRNSVHRRLYGAISLVLTYKLGKSRRNEIMQDVAYKTEDDTRMISLTNEEIYRLLDGLKAWNVNEDDNEIWVIALIAITTGADISDICRATLRQLKTFEHENAQWAELYLSGTKKSQGVRRDRTVILMPDVTSELIPIVQGKLDENRFDVPLFNVKQSRFSTVFQKVRASIGLNEVRPKDLRALFSHLAEESGAPLTRIKNAMGHKSTKMTEKYLRRETGLGIDDVKKMQTFLNLEKQQKAA